MNIRLQRRSRPLRLLFLVLSCLAILQLGACASFDPGYRYTTEAEVLSRKGEPNRRWANSDGSTVLEFSTQPYGHSCLMVEVDADGMVLRQWDALARENLAQVRKGMTMEEVARVLGEHRSEQHFKLSGEDVWDWNIRNDGPGIATLFNVHFIDGVVVRTSQTYVFPRNGAVIHGPSLWFGYGYGHGYGYRYGYPYYHHPFFYPYPFFPWR